MSEAGARQNGQSFMPRFRAAKKQPLQTFVMQHGLNTDCCQSSGKGSWQIGQSSSSDLLRPFFIRTSWFAAVTHSTHRRMLCLRTRWSSKLALARATDLHDMSEVDLSLQLSLSVAVCVTTCPWRQEGKVWMVEWWVFVIARENR